MNRDHMECAFLRLVTDNGSSQHVCNVVEKILGAARPELARTSAAACAECCRHRVPSTSHINPVIASLVYRGAQRILGDPEATWLEKQEASRSQRYVHDRLEAMPIRTPAAPPGGVAGQATTEGSGTSSPQPPRVVWAVGMLTAPRAIPTIHRAARNLVRAGFPEVHLFAEPGSWIPGEIAHWPTTFHGRTLGNLGNFYTSLAALLMLDPEADCYVLFQDDVQAADGLRAWCERQLWPHGCGLLSLYTCGAVQDDEPGWRVREPGLHHTFGGLAFVFRRDVLRRFLCDGRLHEIRVERPQACDDLVVGEWASRTGIGIAYHTPSLIGHLGAVSSMEANSHGIEGPLTRAYPVRRVRDLDRWSPSPREPGKVGLVGWNTATGLGSLNRDLASHLPIARWLVPRHPQFPTLEAPVHSPPMEHVRLDMDHDEMRRWLRGLDWVLFVELPYLPSLVGCARELGIQVACIPMWEYLEVSLEWVRLCDLMICPNHFSHDLLRRWKAQYGFGWELTRVPWPVDTSRFAFRPRTRCERVLFVNGTGGGTGRRMNGTDTEYHRKGLEIILETARLLPRMPFVLSSQVDVPVPLPGNVQLLQSPTDNARLFDAGDLCIQPSHWEGLGLQLLECQAAGLPLITTDAPPMNEYQPLHAVVARSAELVTVYRERVVTAHNLAPEDLAAVLDPLRGADISEASRAARAFVEANHSWDHARTQLWKAMSRPRS